VAGLHYFTLVLTNRARLQCRYLFGSFKAGRAAWKRGYCRWYLCTACARRARAPHCPVGSARVRL